MVYAHVRTENNSKVLSIKLIGISGADGLYVVWTKSSNDEDMMFMARDFY